MKPMDDIVVKSQIELAKRAAAMLDMDDEAFLLTLESQTMALEHCEELVITERLVESHMKALDILIGEFNTRLDFLGMRKEKLRKRMLLILEAAGLKSLKLPSASLSVSYRSHTLVNDPDLVPNEYLRRPPPEPMKQLIGAALKTGQDVPGCVLSNPEPSLTIRVK